MSYSPPTDAAAPLSSWVATVRSGASHTGAGMPASQSRQELEDEVQRSRDERARRRSRLSGGSQRSSDERE